MRKVFVGIGLGIAVVALSARWAGVGILGGADDEAPIRVRNGSIEIWPSAQQADSQGARWQKREHCEQGDGLACYSNEPLENYLDRRKKLFVRVIETAGCADAKTVWPVDSLTVEYSDGHVLTFKRDRSGIYNYRVQAAPSEGLDSIDDGERLRYGPSGTGFIRTVQADGPKRACSFTDATQLTEIRVCSRHDAC